MQKYIFLQFVPTFLCINSLSPENQCVRTNQKQFWMIERGRKSTTFLVISDGLIEFFALSMGLGDGSLHFLSYLILLDKKKHLSLQIENRIYKMQKLIKRASQDIVNQYLDIFPAVVILGSRQCGKSTLIKMMADQLGNFLYLDLQNRDDWVKLEEPTLLFQNNQDRIICLDEIQLRPELFSVLRSEIDRDRRPGRFLLLGSASQSLVKNSTETLAGRIGIIDLTPFLIKEVEALNDFDLKRYWWRGGYPDSYNAASDESSRLWRENFIRTYVERDIPQLGYQITSMQMLRLMTMLAHSQGQLLNASKLGESLGITHPTIRRHIDILEQTYLVRTLPPYFANTKKRLVKSPKVYLRDSGLLHQLLSIRNFNELLGQPVFGASWEGLVVENVCASIRNATFSFYRTATGNEIDLIVEKANKTIAIECKASTAPQLTEGFWKSLDDIQPDEAYVVAPVASSYEIKNGVKVCNLMDLLHLV